MPHLSADTSFAFDVFATLLSLPNDLRTWHFAPPFCDPFNPTIIELGDIAESQIMHTFDKVPWVDYLTQMQTRGENEIHFSPSLEIENKATRSGLTISVVGNPEKYEFYVFYKRPKKITRFLGLTSRMNNNYLTDAVGLNHQDARDCLQALLDGNDAWLDQIIRS